MGVRAEQRIATLKNLLDDYDFSSPLHHFLKEYFRKNKNAGSKDRRVLKTLAYHFYRLGNALKSEDFNTRVLLSHFLCSTTPNEILDELLEKKTGILPGSVSLNVIEKIKTILTYFPGFSEKDIFPCIDEISEQINKSEFILSHLVQPYVWVKIVKQKDEFDEELAAKNISVIKKTSEDIYALPAEASLQDMHTFKQGCFRIQDINTQRTVDFFLPKKDELWWDVCAGAGGKSLALFDANPEVKLYTTDVRESILQNLSTRLKLYGRKAHKILECDVTKKLPAELPMFDGIIADMPCTGSGTWVRHPENLVHFSAEKILKYATVQLQILRNIYKQLKPGKPLIYITCSVFNNENEKVIETFAEEENVIIETQKYLPGYIVNGENIFICRLIKPTLS